MKPLKLLSILFLITSISTTAQKHNHSSCGSDEVHLKLKKENPVYRDSFDKMNNDWQIYAQRKATESFQNRGAFTPQTLTVVFHDMIAPSTPAQTSVNGLYQTIVNNLNFHFAGSNSGGINTQIQFCLAGFTNQLNSYSGATTVHSTTIASLNKEDQTQINSLITQSGSQGGSGISAPFPTSRYINIYIVNDILGSVAGFATLPSSHGLINDGIFIERSWLTGANPNDIKILVHEMGHYLGLFHTFGICDPTLNVPGCSCDNNNCLFNGDMVCDTPPNVMDDDVPCGTASNTCSTDAAFTVSDGSPNNPTGDINDPKDNYMDYNNDQSCVVKFTNGQITRMHFMIDEEFGPRKSLLNNHSCDDCTAIDGCEFSIIPDAGLINNEITLITNPLPLNFTASNLGCLASPTLTYTWELGLSTSTTTSVIQTGTGLSFNPSVTTSGNYILTLTVAVTNTPQCIETKIYTFKVIDQMGPCNLVLPTDNNNWGNWNRVSYKNGWSRLISPPYNYAIPGTIRSTPNDANFDPKVLKFYHPQPLILILHLLQDFLQQLIKYCVLDELLITTRTIS